MSSKHELTYHLVFVTKYRKPALLGIEQSVYRAVANSARGGGFTIIEQAVDLGDHLHLVVKADPAVAPAALVRRLKQLTTLELWATEASQLRRFYWGRKRRLWSAGYFVSTVGSVSKEIVLDYVRRQDK